MATEIQPATEDSQPLRLRLQRLWKGTLYVGIASAYVALIVVVLVGYGWRAALLTFGLIVIAQLLRYIAYDVSKVGWALAKQGSEAQGATKLQRRMQALLLLIIYAIVVALIAQAYVLMPLNFAIAVAVGLVVAESFYLLIHRTNRAIAYADASFGAADGRVFASMYRRPRKAESQQSDELNRRLAQLQKLADSGDISPKAYRRTRDKLHVNYVLQRDEP